MFRTSRKAVAAAIFAIGFGAGAGQAFAIPTLTATDGANTVIILDGGVLDGCNLVGCVSFVGPVGSWNINILGGFTKPVLGSPASPHLDLSFNDNYVGTSASTLTILWSDTDFSTGFPLTTRSDIGGTRAGGITSVAYADFASSTNTINALTTALCAGSFATAAFSGSCSAPFNGPAPFSVTQRIVLTATGPGQASGNHSLQVPEPGTLALIGLGLVGLGFARRKQA